MATKTQTFKAELQRAAYQDKPPTDRERAAAAAKARAAGRPKAAPANPTGHHEAASHAKKTSYAFEVSATARPSRKSTRKSSNRQKTDNALRLKAVNLNSSPETRARRPSGKPT